MGVNLTTGHWREFDHGAVTEGYGEEDTGDNDNRVIELDQLYQGSGPLGK